MAEIRTVAFLILQENHYLLENIFFTNIFFTTFYYYFKLQIFLKTLLKS